MIFKNVAGQGTYVFAVDAYGEPKPGVASTITAVISKDGSAPPVPTATANPVEIGSGLYWLPLSQAETDCNAGAVVASGAGLAIDPTIFCTTGGAIPFVVAGQPGGLVIGGTSGAIPANVVELNGQPAGTAGGAVPANLVAVNGVALTAAVTPATPPVAGKAGRV